MSTSATKPLGLETLLEQALARWENEGGSDACGPQQSPLGEDAESPVPALTNAELVQLQVRVIALENLVISLLADSSDAQRVLAREMAAYISPRPGFTRHHLTTHAAAQMKHMLERAGLFRGVADWAVDG
ncbi:hypothetical protein WKW77_25040 [Variovorax ureilyticus]|uniref:Uncharacterized protein n=1 Tax=Variovorax ureilyticus TaxID=1836198 RepID=A0ABU8VN98_9BURK